MVWKKSQVVFADLGVVQLLKHCQKALTAFSGAALCNVRRNELRRESSAWERDVHALSFVQHDAQVLEEVLDVGTRLKIAFEHARAECRHHEAASCALTEQIKHLV